VTFADRLVASWYSPRPDALALLLSPLSLLFRGVVALRRASYRAGVLRAERLPVPVVVVGNITAGGSGKTPLTIGLAVELAARGWRPGIVSRGFGGNADSPRAARPDSSPNDVGDEPLLLARAGFPVWVGKNRCAAARGLLAAHPDCKVIIADDGLQHYALARDVEIAVVDAARGIGNGLLLPAGPLREAPSRLEEVDAVVQLIEPGRPPEAGRAYAMRLAGERFVRVNAPAVTAAADYFRGGAIHAVAGIGHPARFFASLRALGLDPACHAFSDHYRFTAADLDWPGATAILMTEKDAVKCASFADDRYWALPVRAAVAPALVALVEERIRGFQAA
jgi:tetraacyldisaccharide 4'-kinase